jgi:copper transport protein
LAVPAEAHAALLAASPPPSALLDSPPGAVTLIFSEDVTPVAGGVAVFDPSGRVASGQLRVAGRRIEIGVASALEGTYRVAWAVVAEDTHPARGTYTFSVGHASAPPVPGFRSGDTAQVTPGGLVLQALARLMHFLGLALGFGVPVAALLLGRRDESVLGAARRIAGVAVALLLGAEAVAVVAQAASLGAGLDGDTLSSVMASPFGRYVALRAGAGLLLWAVLALPETTALAAAVVVGTGAAAVDGLASHRAPIAPAAVVLLGGVHVAAMAGWLGTVALSVVVARRGRPVPHAARLVGAAAAFLLISGLALAVVHLRSPGDLVSTAYGAVLTIKVAIALAVGTFAFAVRRRAAPILARIRMGEALALAGVLALAGLLLSVPPPR